MGAACLQDIWAGNVIASIWLINKKYNSMLNLVQKNARGQVAYVMFWVACIAAYFVPAYVSSVSLSRKTVSLFDCVLVGNVYLPYWLHKAAGSTFVLCYVAYVVFTLEITMFLMAGIRLKSAKMRLFALLAQGAMIGAAVPLVLVVLRVYDKIAISDIHPVGAAVLAVLGYCYTIVLREPARLFRHLRIYGITRLT
jgi:hypothetical protein